MMKSKPFIGSFDNNKPKSSRLMYRGASYADVTRYQRCIDLWRRALQIRIEKDTVLYTDTGFTAQALVKIMLDFNTKSVQNNIDNTEKRFHDIVETLKLLYQDVIKMRSGLLIRPPYQKQLDVFGKIVRYSLSYSFFLFIIILIIKLFQMHYALNILNHRDGQDEG